MGQDRTPVLLRCAEHNECKNRPSLRSNWEELIRAARRAERAIASARMRAAARAQNPESDQESTAKLERRVPGREACQTTMAKSKRCCGFRLST